MKGIVELKSYRANVTDDAGREECARTAQVHPFVPRQAVNAVADADAKPPGERLVSLAFMRGPDARASLPLGPCLPRLARRYFEVRLGTYARVRCRLSAPEGRQTKR